LGFCFLVVKILVVCFVFFCVFLGNFLVVQLFFVDAAGVVFLYNFVYMCMFKMVFVLIPIIDDDVLLLLLLLLLSFVSIFTKQYNFPHVFRDVAFAHKRLRGINCSHLMDLTVILCCFVFANGLFF
jgi:hypothetical protein